MKLYGGSRNASRAEKPVKKKGRIVKIIGISALSLFALALAVIAAWSIFIKPPDVSSKRTAPDPVRRFTPRPNADSSSPPEKEDAKIYRDGVYTVLFTGTYEDGNTDTIMVACVDVPQKKIGVISIPRDTVVNVNRKIKKINGAYGVGGGNEKGMENMQAELSTILGFTPDYYAMVKMKGFKKLIDDLGGVDFDVPVRMYKPEEGIDLKAGMTHLNGDKALQLMRYRGYSSNNKAGVPNDDYGRMYVQQQFLKEVMKQFLQVQSIAKIPEFAKNASENIKPTDLSVTDMIWFAQTALVEIGFENITFQTLPTASIHYTGGNGTSSNWYENILVNEAIEMINSTVNPYTFDITEGMLDILTLRN